MDLHGCLSLSASCSSGQRFAFSFLRIPPRGGHPCCSANTSPCRVCRGLSPPSECALPGAPKKKARPLGPAFVNVTKGLTVLELRLWRLKNVALFAQARRSGRSFDRPVLAFDCCTQGGFNSRRMHGRLSAAPSRSEIRAPMLLRKRCRTDQPDRQASRHDNRPVRGLRRPPG